MDQIFQEEATTTRTLRNIRTALRENLRRKYNADMHSQEELKEIEDELLKIHGLSKNSFDFVSRIDEIISGHLNDQSIDDNSNKNEKSIAGITSEVTQSVSKAIGYDYLYRSMRELYGKKGAKKLAGDMYDYSIAISDSTKLLIPYCWALDASKIVMEGRPFGQLHSLPPKRVASYISSLNETIHQMSSHLAGAIAVGSFFMDIAHILIFKEKYSLEDIKNNEDLRKYIENNYQSFVHSVNHLSRKGVESPFTNISILDRTKLQSFLANDNMGWLFDSNFFGGNITKDYAIEYIMELQNIFLDFFDKGDPSHDGLPYRFPVVTLNISKDESTGKIKDEDSFKNYINREIYRYNIFVSEGEKIASCCRLLSDSEMLDVAGQSNSFGGSGSVSLGSHRVATINFNRIALEANGNEDKYFDILNDRIINTVKILKAHKQLIETLTGSGLQPFVEMGWIKMERLFSTVGILGMVEAVDTLQTRKHDSLMEDTLKLVNSKAEELGKEYGLNINIEQIPAESMSHRLPKADKLLFGENKIPYKLYANQFIPLWKDVSLWERMEKDGKFNKLITGGGIVHFSLGEKTTKAQNKKIVKYAIETGSEHFALNTVYSVCENEHTYLGHKETCPKCESKDITHYTRTVGFFTPVEDWTKQKRDYDYKRRLYKRIE